MPEKQMYEDGQAVGLVTRPEFVMYCRSVNGDLTDLKESMKKLDTTLENRHRETRDDIRLTFANTEKALATSNASIEKALATANKSTEKALEGTMSKSYAIIITVITGLLMGLLGAFISLLVRVK